MAVGIVNTLRQVGTATGVAVLGARYATRVTASTLHALAALPIPLPHGSARLLASAVGSGAGIQVASGLPGRQPRRSIEAGIAHLADKYGEDWLFVGPPRAQATAHLEHPRPRTVQRPAVTPKRP